jgi:chemotaxis signal transduction protein
MGRIDFTRRLTRRFDETYLQASNHYVRLIPRATQADRPIQAGMVLNTAVADDAAAAPALPQWLVFRCEDALFGVPLDRVREIVPPRAMTRLPGAVAGVCGLAGVRGRVVTVVDLGVLLGCRPSAPLPEHRLLLLDLDGRRLGAAVDEVVTIAAAQVEAPAGGAPVVQGRVGMGRTDDTAFVALDPVRLLARLLSPTIV